MNSFQKLLDFLNKLDEAEITYSIEHNRDETVMVVVSVLDERWEVEFFADGEVEVEVFYASTEEDLEGEEALDRLFDEHSNVDFDDDDDDDDDEEDK